MAQTISIGSTQHIDLFKAKLGRQLKLCEGDGLKIYLEESPAGKYTFLFCRIADDKGKRAGRMSRAFSSTTWPMSYLISSSTTGRIPCSRKSSEKTTIILERKRETSSFNTLCVTLTGRGKTSEYSLLAGAQKPDYPKILDYLDANNWINIDGFIRFRAQRLHRGTARCR